MVAGPTLAALVEVISPRRCQNGEAVAVAERDRVSIGLNRATFVEDKQLRLEVQNNGIGPEGLVVPVVLVLCGVARGGKTVVLRHNFRVMRIGQGDRAGIGLLLFRGESKDHHLGGRTGEVFSLVSRAVALIRDRVQSLADIQFPPVVFCARVAELDVNVAKGLIGAGVLLAADPEGILVELDVFAFDAAEDHAPQVAVAERQCLFLPVVSRLVIPQDALPGLVGGLGKACIQEGQYNDRETNYCQEIWHMEASSIWLAVMYACG